VGQFKQREGKIQSRTEEGPVSVGGTPAVRVLILEERNIGVRKIKGTEKISGGLLVLYRGKKGCASGEGKRCSSIKRIIGSPSNGEEVWKVGKGGLGEDGRWPHNATGKKGLACRHGGWGGFTTQQAAVGALTGLFSGEVRV